MMMKGMNLILLNYFLEWFWFRSIGYIDIFKCMLEFDLKLMILKCLWRFCGMNFF